jgi:hypothetical protein
MPRIPNHKIDEKVSNLESFENYNATIHAVRSGERYTIVHWNTVILEYNTSKQEITNLASEPISQTTSTLVGRILRSLPRKAVLSFIATLPNRYDQRRLSKMIRL